MHTNRLQHEASLKTLKAGHDELRERFAVRRRRKIGNNESYVAATRAVYYAMVGGESTFARVTLMAFSTAP